MKERIKGRKNFPTDEVDPENYLSDDDIRNLIQDKDNITFEQDDFYKLYNCVHCGECETEEERLLLKQKYLEDGNKDLKEFLLNLILFFTWVVFLRYGFQDIQSIRLNICLNKK
jgi:hypothetical protein